MSKFLTFIVLVVFSIIAYPLYPLIVRKDKFDKRGAKKRVLLNCMVVNIIGAIIYMILNGFGYLKFVEGFGYMLLFSLIFYFIDKKILINGVDDKGSDNFLIDDSADVKKAGNINTKIGNNVGEKIYCRKCGSALSGDVKYCAICGAKTQEIPEESSDDTNFVNNDPDDELDIPDDVDEVYFGLDNIDEISTAVDDVIDETNNASETVESVEEIAHEETPEECRFCGGKLENFSSDMYIFTERKSVKNVKGKLCVKCGNIAFFYVDN